MRQFPLALLFALAACGGEGSVSNNAVSSAQQDSERAAVDDVVAAQNAEAAAIAETDAALDNIANEVGEPAAPGNAR